MLENFGFSRFRFHCISEKLFVFWFFKIYKIKSSFCFTFLPDDILDFQFFISLSGRMVKRCALEFLNSCKLVESYQTYCEFLKFFEKNHWVSLLSFLVLPLFLALFLPISIIISLTLALTITLCFLVMYVLMYILMYI